jgi:uncharacterized repeat protein (TIGR02543 family)
MLVIVLIVNILGAGAVFAVPSTYTVTYDGNGNTGGTVPAAHTNVTSGASITVSGEADLVKTDYMFLGWNTAANGSGTAYTSGASIVVTGDMTLYAQWVQFTLTYDKNEGVVGTVSGTVPAAVVTTGTSITVSTSGGISVTGYTFGGWSTTTGGGIDYAPGSSYNTGLPSTTTSASLYAVWLSNDSTLSDLELSTGTLSPTFSAGTTSYTATVANSVTSVTVTPTANQGDATVKVNDTSVTTGAAITLSVGSNTVEVEVTAEDASTTTYTVVITRDAEEEDDEDDDDSGTTTPSTPSDETVVTTGGEKSVTVEVDEDEIDDLVEDSLASGSDTVTVEITTTGADNVAVNLGGDVLSKVAENGLTLEVKSDQAIFQLPADELTSPELLEELGVTNIKDMSIEVSMNKVDVTVGNKFAEQAQKQGAEVIFAGLEFEITLTNDVTGETIRLKKFKKFVPRMVKLPETAQADQVTTGVIVNTDGTYSHIPTIVVEIDGIKFIKMNSLTNSVYAVIKSDVAFNDMNGHWANDTVNLLGSKLILNGKDGSSFMPDESITRAEFASMLSKALGIYRDEYSSNYIDVSKVMWHYNAVTSASEFGLVKGYDDGMFNANQMITREEAMVILARATQSATTPSTTNLALGNFSDSTMLSTWAKADVLTTLQTGIIVGSDNMLKPTAMMTRAEAASAIYRLLVNSGLI